MTKYLKQGLNFFLFSNIFIAFCAVSQGLLTYWLLQIRLDKPVLGILFFSTLAIYNFSILLAKPKYLESSPFLRVRWVFSYYKLIICLLIISILCLLALIFFINLSSLILLFLLGCISLAYNLPIWTKEGKKHGIRSIPGLKIFIIALVWAGSTVLFPVFAIEDSANIEFSNQKIFLLFLNRFLFIVAITIPFDIRDLFQDKLNELKTIPVLLGEKKSLLLCQLFLLAHFILLFLFTEKWDVNLWVIGLSVFITGWLIFKSKWKKNEYYYFLFLDGTLILQSLLLALFHIET